MVRINLGLVVILSILGITGSFFTAIMSHEVIHVLQSKDAIHLSYDLNQGTYAHVVHNVNSWNNNQNFINFVKYTENTADNIELFTGYFASFIVGSCAFALVFQRIEDDFAKVC